MNQNTFTLKSGLAQMLKGGVIMDVTNSKQAKIAEDSGAVAVMALERVPADIRAQGGVSRMSDPLMIKEIQKTVTIPVMAKCRIGHFAEAQILEFLKVDYVDESEVLTPADEEFHVDKNKFKVPFVCGARNLGEALRRINEGAAMIRTKGEAGTGNIVEAVKHIRSINSEIEELKKLNNENKSGNENNFDESESKLKSKAEEYKVPLELVKKVKELGKLPVVNFAAGGIATPADASLCMQLGVDGVFVGSGIFKSTNPEQMAKAIVNAVANYKNPEKVAQASEGLGDAMKGLDVANMKDEDRLALR